MKVDGFEGRAGMAAIVLDDGSTPDLGELRDHLKRQLPDYARPVFLRIRPALDVTGTFKQRKIELVKEGCDPTIISDRLYFDDPREGRYVPLDAELHKTLESGSVRI